MKKTPEVENFLDRNWKVFSVGNFLESSAFSCFGKPCFPREHALFDCLIWMFVLLP